MGRNTSNQIAVISFKMLSQEPKEQSPNCSRFPPGCIRLAAICQFFSTTVSKKRCFSSLTDFVFRQTEVNMAEVVVV